MYCIHGDNSSSKINYSLKDPRDQMQFVDKIIYNVQMKGSIVNFFLV